MSMHLDFFSIKKEVPNALEFCTYIEKETSAKNVGFKMTEQEIVEYYTDWYDQFLSKNEDQLRRVNDALYKTDIFEDEDGLIKKVKKGYSVKHFQFIKTIFTEVTFYTNGSVKLVKFKATNGNDVILSSDGNTEASVVGAQTAKRLKGSDKAQPETEEYKQGKKITLEVLKKVDFDHNKVFRCRHKDWNPSMKKPKYFYYYHNSA
jgi:hypothetical protein